MNNGVGIDEEGDYFNSWGVTDNYVTDYPICLSINEDFMQEGDDYMQIDCDNEEIELRITEIEAVLDNELYENEDEKRCLELELQGLEKELVE